MQTSLMEAEHVSESIRPLWNGFERAAATMENVEHRLHYATQAAWLQSDSDIPELPKQKISREYSHETLLLIMTISHYSINFS